MLNRLNVARASLILSIVVGWKSLWAAFGHIGKDQFLLVSIEGGKSLPTHGWYHFFREGVGDLAALAILLLLLFGPKSFRSPQTWIIGLIVCFGYYAPFWIGAPFNSALSAPSLEAELIHVGMAVLAVLALLVSKRDFYGK